LSKKWIVLKAFNPASNPRTVNQYNRNKRIDWGLNGFLVSELGIRRKPIKVQIEKRRIDKVHTKVHIKDKIQYQLKKVKERRTIKITVRKLWSNITRKKVYQDYNIHKQR